MTNQPQTKECPECHVWPTGAYTTKNGGTICTTCGGTGKADNQPGYPMFSSTECSSCGGTGRLTITRVTDEVHPELNFDMPCPHCKGTGTLPTPAEPSVPKIEKLSPIVVSTGNEEYADYINAASNLELLRGIADKLNEVIDRLNGENQ